MVTPRNRILGAAEQIFGQKGYKAATVREICKAADVNLAAVNYYFGDKSALYRTVVTGLIEQAVKRYPADLGVTADTPADQRLKAFVRSILHRLLAPSGGLSSYRSKGQLLARELADPSPALDAVVQSYIGPQAAILSDIIRELLPRPVSQDQLMRCAFSVIGQCFYYGYAWPIITRIAPIDLDNPATIERLAEHITAFSLGGLTQFKIQNHRK
ncbi:MAG: CerR family C-terminal domain-containing protein [Desulfatitalea sp.]